MRLFLCVVCSITLFSCTRNNDLARNNSLTNAYVPVYAQPNEIEQIAVEGITNTANAGKIYAYGNYIFQNEINKGFHIINNSSAATAKKIGFLKVPFSTEIAIKGDYLYCNNVSDLVVFNISNASNPVLVKRIKNAFPLIEQTHPSLSNVFFECVDKSKGIVVSWQQKMIQTPNCKR
jgi:hypothetical protein